MHNSTFAVYKNRKYIPYIIVVVFSFIYLIKAVSYLRMPGFDYDEVIYTNAALGGITDSFVYKRIFGIPIMIMPYIGALKAYIYYPVFAIFGISPESIRLTSILLSLITIWMAFLLLKEIINPVFASIIAMLISTDPAFIFYSKLDFGPVVLATLFRVTSFYLLYKFLNTKQIKYFWTILLILTLGLYEKLNFIWFIIAFGIAVIVIYYKEFLQSFKDYSKKFYLPLLGFIFINIFVGLKMILPLFTSGISSKNWELVEKIKHTINIYFGTMNGKLFYEFITGTQMHEPSKVNYYSIFIALGLVIILLYWLLKKTKKQDLTIITRQILFYLIIFAVVFCEIVLTKDATGGHHIMMLYPFHHIILVLVIYFLYLIIPISIKQIYKVFASILFFSILIFSQINATNLYLYKFESNKEYNPRWDTKIYQLSDYIESIEKDKVISIDWGTNNQLFTLANRDEKGKYVDLWPIFSSINEYSSEQKKWVYDELFSDKSIIVLHSEETEQMVNNRENFFSFISDFDCKLELIKKFENTAGTILYEVYVLNK